MPVREFTVTVVNHPMTENAKLTGVCGSMKKSWTWITGISFTAMATWFWAVVENGSETLHNNLVKSLERIGIELPNQIISFGVDVIIFYVLAVIFLISSLAWLWCTLFLESSSNPRHDPISKDFVNAI